MATSAFDRSGSFLRKAEEDLTCPVCYEIFIDPRIPKILQGCTHVVCLVCLNAMPEGVVPGTKTCPECRAVTQIPLDGVKGLKTNLRVLNLSESFYKLMQDKNVYENCDIHNGKSKTSVCTRCRKVICPVCFEQTHSTHKVQALENFKKERIKDEEGISAELATKMTDLSEYSNKLSRMEETIQRALQIEKVKVHKHVESIIAALKEKEDEIITELHEVTKTENLQTIRDERGRVSRLMEKIKIIQEDPQSSMTDKISDDQICMSEFSRANKKCLVNESTRIHAQVTLDVNIGQFQPQSFELNIGEFKKIGKFQLVTDFGVFKDPRSLALTSTGLIVILDWDVTVACLHVYDYSRRENEYVWKTAFQLSEYADLGNGNPIDLAIARTDKYMVACGTCVDVFSSTGQYIESMYAKKVNARQTPQRRSFKQSSLQSSLQSLRGVNAKSKHASKVHCLVVTSDGKFIVGNSAESTITIFNSDHTVFKDSFKIPFEDFQPLRLATKGNQLAMVDVENNKLCAMDIETEEIAFRINITAPQGLCFSADNILVTVGAKDGAVEQFCGQTGLWLGQVVRGLHFPLDITTISDDRVVVLCKDKANVFSINRL